MMSGVFQIILVIGCCVGIYLVDRVGRRRLLLASFVVLSLCLAVFAACSAKYEATRSAGKSIWRRWVQVGTNVYSTAYGNGGIAMVMIFIFFFGSISGVPYAYAAEVLPTKNRAIGFAMGLFCSNAVTIIFTQTAPMALEAISWKFNFVFIGCNAVFFPIVYLYFPEVSSLAFFPRISNVSRREILTIWQTKGLTLEGVNAVFGAKVEVDISAINDETAEAVKAGQVTMAECVEPRDPEA